MSYIIFLSRARPRRSREETRRELGVGGEVMLLHSSNLRPPKWIDLLLAVAARIRPREAFKPADPGRGQFAPFEGEVRRLGLEDRVIVREKVTDIEDYLQAANYGAVHLGIGDILPEHFGGDVFCVSERGLARGRDSGSGGGRQERGAGAFWGDRGDGGGGGRIDGRSGRRSELGRAAQVRARELFSAEIIVPRYQELYRRVCAGRCQLVERGPGWQDGGA